MGDWYNKDFAIAYNRVICLVDGQYKVTYNQFSNDALNAWTYQRIYVNGVIHAETIAEDEDWVTSNINCNVFLKRGDYHIIAESDLNIGIIFQNQDSSIC